jgi:hypothetical protein
MRENIKKANEVLLEGDRDAVLRHLQGDSSYDHEVIWLRAHAAANDEERLSLLRSLSQRSPSTYQELAYQIIEREDRFEAQLNEPPDYKFWKLPTWQERKQRLKQYGVWVAGGLFLLVMIVFAIATTINQERQKQQVASEQTEMAQMTQTAVAYTTQKVANYPEGSLIIRSLDFPTNRPVTFGEQDNNQYLPATPAIGSRFGAVQVRFTCNQAICSSPPEAQISLLLTNGQEVRYSSRMPFLTDQQPIERISNRESVDIWLVFEVPIGASPDALLVYASGQEAPLYVDWP